MTERNAESSVPGQRRSSSDTLLAAVEQKHNDSPDNSVTEEDIVAAFLDEDFLKSTPPSPSSIKKASATPSRYPDHNALGVNPSRSRAPSPPPAAPPIPAHRERSLQSPPPPAGMSIWDLVSSPSQLSYNEKQYADRRRKEEMAKALSSCDFVKLASDTIMDHHRLCVTNHEKGSKKEWNSTGALPPYSDHRDASVSLWDKMKHKEQESVGTKSPGTSKRKKNKSKKILPGVSPTTGKKSNRDSRRKSSMNNSSSDTSTSRETSSTEPSDVSARSACWDSMNNQSASIPEAQPQHQQHTGMSVQTSPPSPSPPKGPKQHVPLATTPEVWNEIKNRYEPKERVSKKKKKRGRSRKTVPSLPPPRVAQETWPPRRARSLFPPPCTRARVRWGQNTTLFAIMEEEEEKSSGDEFSTDTRDWGSRHNDGDSSMRLPNRAVRSLSPPQSFSQNRSWYNSFPADDSPQRPRRKKDKSASLVALLPGNDTGKRKKKTKLTKRKAVSLSPKSGVKRKTKKSGLSLSPKPRVKKKATIEKRHTVSLSPKPRRKKVTRSRHDDPDLPLSPLVSRKGSTKRKSSKVKSLKLKPKTSLEKRRSNGEKQELEPQDSAPRARKRMVVPPAPNLDDGPEAWEVLPDDARLGPNQTILPPRRARSVVTLRSKQRVHWGENTVFECSAEEELSARMWNSCNLDEQVRLPQRGRSLSPFQRRSSNREWTTSFPIKALPTEPEEVLLIPPFVEPECPMPAKKVRPKSKTVESPNRSPKPKLDKNPSRKKVINVSTTESKKDRVKSTQKTKPEVPEPAKKKTTKVSAPTKVKESFSLPTKTVKKKGNVVKSKHELEAAKRALERRKAAEAAAREMTGRISVSRHDKRPSTGWNKIV